MTFVVGARVVVVNRDSPFCGDEGTVVGHTTTGSVLVEVLGFFDFGVPFEARELLALP